MRISKLILLSSFLIPTYTFGETTFNSVSIKDVILNMKSGIHFKINEPMANNENCGSNSWFKVESGTTYEKEALSLLLTYQAQNKPITIYLKGCTGGYPKLYYIY